ncbi:MAG: hypothetical protein LBR72_02560 [Oscillospiraceae bacterium]|jgi:regulatory protein YycI of two-component signal transduction system YycFG|nr:hypothetical protein [Oscillospiraceae bacterium]
MNWKTAKTVLLLLLLAVNLILGGLWLYRETQMRTGETRAGVELCALLEQNGLHAEPEQLPKITSMTYDAEQIPGGALKTEVNGLPVWEQTVSPVSSETVSPAAGQAWGTELPVDGRESLSAGACLLRLTESWSLTGQTLELCELGYSAESYATDAIRLTPCWRFTISGLAYYVFAA